MIPGVVGSAVGPANAPRDQYYTSVVALLHLDGGFGSTTFTDEKGHIFTGGGGVVLSTSEKKFGTASIEMNGTTQYLQSATSTDWEMGSGDFTFEAWVRPAAAVTTRMEIFERWATFGIGMQIMDTGFLRAFATNTTSGNVLVGPGATTVTHNTWHHVAFVRGGTTLRLFLDGVSQGTATFSGAPWATWSCA